MKNIILFLIASGLILFTTSCRQDVGENRLDTKIFTELSSEETGVNFENTLDERKDMNVLHFEYFYAGAGVAVGDINMDELPDILFMSNTRANKLYLNKGNMTFEDVTEKAGIKDLGRWGTGAVMGDANGDGLMDIYICNGGPTKDLDSLKNELYINNGDGTFSEEAESYGVAGNHRSNMASFFDYDEDGDLDLFVLNYCDLVFRTYDQDKVVDYPESKYPLNSCVLYRNNGDGSFKDVSEEAGIIKPAFGLGLITTDINGDGLVDIYVSNDYLVPNFMFINKGDGTFEDQTKGRLEHCSHFSMGTDFGDINNDSLIDIIEVDMMPEDHILSKTHMSPMNEDLFFKVKKTGTIPQFMYNSLHVQHGFGLFSEIAQLAGVGKSDWSWAVMFSDVNNDAFQDIFISNGIRRNLKNNDYIQNQSPKVLNWVINGVYDSSFAFVQNYPGYALPNYMYQNNGDLTFTNRNMDWGLDKATYSNGATLADLDLDGDLDLVINNIDQPALIYRNNSADSLSYQWIQFELTDSKTKSIPLNSRVTIKLADGSILSNELTPTRGYMSSTTPIIHFGLGAKPMIERIEIVWPDNSSCILSGVEPNRRHKIDKAQQQNKSRSPNNPIEYAIRDVSGTLFNVPFQHREDEYLDFFREVLLPYQQSTLGPFISVGDANGDGHEDFFIGGAKGQAGRMYFMDPSRGYYVAPCQPWNDHAASEDMGSVFLDADGDGDLDLYVASGGGGEFLNNPELLQDRLYLNDGEGCYSIPEKQWLPKITGSGGKVEAGDINNDGKTDLFVCGRTNPGFYPTPGRSYLLTNTGQGFTDATEELAPGLIELGMITDAKFFDFNGDGQLDLLLSGEWMNITLMISENGQFVDRSAEYGLADNKGWWYSLQLADFDKDGKMDILAGNLGLNNKFKIRKDHPLHVFAKDFDENGSLDIVLSSKYKDIMVPVRGRECSSEQMPFIKEKFPTFSSFAHATLQDIYGEENLKEALHHYADEIRSMVLMNRNDGFEAIPLPMAAQMSPLLSSVVLDANQDNIPDLIIGGDLADTEPETPAFDGSRGMLLTGNGDGTFKAVWLENSGFYFSSNNIRDIKQVKPGNNPGKLLLIAANNSPIQALQFMGKINKM